MAVFGGEPDLKNSTSTGGGLALPFLDDVARTAPFDERVQKQLTLVLAAVATPAGCSPTNRVSSRVRNRV